MGHTSSAAQRLPVAADHSLPPLVHPDVARLAGPAAGELRRLADEGGTPFHIFFPDVMLGTVDRFRRVMDDAGNADGRIYFAVKANDANSPVAVAAAAGIGADVSSAEEFTVALGRGVPGGDISVSGPAKSAALLCLAVNQGALIQIDQPHEIEELAAAAARLGRRLVRVSLRLQVPGSRFGMLLPELQAVIQRIFSLGQAIRPEGVAFHCPDYESADRVAMISQACRVLAGASASGMAPRRISIGGGLAVQYADPDTWGVCRATEREFVGGGTTQAALPLHGLAGWPGAAGADPAGFAESAGCEVSLGNSGGGGHRTRQVNARSGRPIGFPCPRDTPLRGPMGRRNRREQHSPDGGRVR